MGEDRRQWKINGGRQSDRCMKSRVGDREIEWRPGVDSTDKVKHIEINDQLFVTNMM